MRDSVTLDNKLKLYKTDKNIKFIIRFINLKIY